MVSNPPSQHESAILVRTADGGALRRFTASFRIGRDPGNDLALDDPNVSQYHAEVVFEDGKWWVQDLGSTNGVIVGGESIDRAPVETVVRARLGINGPALIFSIEGALHESRKTVHAPPSESRIIDRLFGATDPEGQSDHTAMMRRVIKKEHTRRTHKYRIAVGVFAGLTVIAATVVYVQRQQIARQRAAAVDLFYSLKELELEVARLQASAEQLQSYQRQRSELEQLYQDFVTELGIYSDKTSPEDQLIYRTVHRFGESEVNVPAEFVTEVKRFIERWKTTPRLRNAVERARENGYGPRISELMLERGMPPDFFYLALQESEFNINAVGPDTRFGIAKGMWQFLPGTATALGLNTGPLVAVRRPDPQDDRHHFEKSTVAASRYLRDIYMTEAQASGLLVIASYNWGHNNVLRLIRTMPENPRDRNFWRLLTEYRIPRETYNYVLYIVSAAVIGQDPELFGFDFELPIALQPGPVAMTDVDAEDSN